MLPAWRAAAMFHLGRPDLVLLEAQRFLNGTRSFWVGSTIPTDEAVVRWALQAHPISVAARWEVLRDGLRGAGLPAQGIQPGCPDRDHSGADADRVIADALGVDPHFSASGITGSRPLNSRL